MLTKLVVALTLLAVVAFAGTVPGKIAGGNVTITTAATVSGTALKPGIYRVTVVPGKVLFTSGKDTQEVPAKIETRANKFDENRVQYEGSGAQARISQIGLGGTKLELIFQN